MSNGFVIPFEDKLKCSICQGRLKDARVIACGHTFCKSCVVDAVRAGRQPWNRNIQCPECQRSSQLPTSPFGNADVDALPKCFVLNALLDEISETFGPSGGDLSIGRHGFQTKEIFQCPVCFDPMADGRYLPCGHSYCTGCLTRYPRTPQGNVKCGKCQKEHALPAGGVGALAVTYRINSIVAEMKSGNGLGVGGGSRPNGHPGMRCPGPRSSSSRSSPSSRTTTMMEDVEEAKRQAQARANRIQVFVSKLDGKTVTIDIGATETVRSLKLKIKEKIGLAPNQQSLSYGGSTLEDQRTLQFYGIGNHATIQLNARLRGGGGGTIRHHAL